MSYKRLMLNGLNMVHIYRPTRVILTWIFKSEGLSGALGYDSML